MSYKIEIKGILEGNKKPFSYTYMSVLKKKFRKSTKVYVSALHILLLVVWIKVTKLEHIIVIYKFCPCLAALLGRPNLHHLQCMQSLGLGTTISTMTI